MVNTLVAGAGLLISLIITIYILSLVKRLVKAVELIANQSKKE